MDLVSLANNLKNLSDQQLQMVQRDQSVPPYLVVSEMKRRDDMRKAYTAQQQQPKPPTVAQQVVGQFQQGLQRPPMPQGPPQAPPMPTQQGGIASIMQGPQMGAFSRPGLTPQQGPPPAMRGGGIVAFADGGETEDDAPDAGPYMADPGIISLLGSMAAQDEPEYRWVPRVSGSVSGMPTTVEQWKNSPLGRGRNIDDVNKMLDSIQGTDYLSPIAQKIAALEAKMSKKGSSLGGTLMALGLGMAASRNPTFAGAVGEGGLGALQRYDQQKQQEDALRMQLMGAEAETARAQQQRAEQRIHNALGAWEKMGADDNVMQSELGANQRRIYEAQQRAELQNAELEQKYQANLAKLNLKDTPDSVNNAAMIANDPDETPARRKWAKDVIATHIKLAEAKMRPDPNAPITLLPKPVLPAGTSIVGDRVVFGEGGGK